MHFGDIQNESFNALRAKVLRYNSYYSTRFARITAQFSHLLQRLIRDIQQQSQTPNGKQLLPVLRQSLFYRQS